MRIGVTGFGATAMTLLALTGSFLSTTGGPASAKTTPSAQPASSAKTTAAKPNPAEGHSPQVNKALSGPLTGTGTARNGSAASVPVAVRQATAAAANTMLNGLDVASGQHPNGAAINWPTVAGAGYQFAAVKATEGNYYTNPYYANDAQAATAAGLYVAPYAFANPYDPASNGTATQQADYAVTGTASYKVGGRYLPMLLDLEPDPYATQDNVNQCYGLSASAMVTWISQFLAEAQAKTGASPVIYTTTNWWNTCTGNSTAFAGNVLWIASYSAGTPGALPAGWNSWNMWQYSSAGTVPGISVPVDLDYFSGTPETKQTLVNTLASARVRTLSGLTGQAETYTAAGLPPGMSMDSSGQITGTPTTTGPYTVTVTPSASGTVVPASMSFTWDVHGTITVTAPTSQATTAGSPVSLQVTATDSVPGYTPSFTAAGLPPGLAISSAGQITGWPDTPGTYTTTVTATDSLGASSSASFTWNISQAANTGSAGQVKVANSGKCLDDPAGNTATGTKLDIWTCNGGTNQKWTVVQDGTLRVSGKCLDVAGGGTANGSAVQLGTCTAGAASQRWQVGASAELINSHSGRCLDVAGASTANGSKLDLYTCNGGTNQRWPLPAGPVSSEVPGECLADNGGSSANGTAIIDWTCNRTAPENWSVASDGTVRIYGKCLDVTGGGTASGTKIDLWSCTGGSNQQWKVTPAGDLAGQMVNPHSGLCLAIPADPAANGTQMQLRPCAPLTRDSSWNVR